MKKNKNMALVLFQKLKNLFLEVAHDNIIGYFFPVTHLEKSFHSLGKFHNIIFIFQEYFVFAVVWFLLNKNFQCGWLLV